MTVKTTQRQNVARRLLEAPLCGTTRDPNYGIRIAARINELRNVGFVIDNEVCSSPRHQHNSKQIEYVLRHRSEARDKCALCGGTLRSSVRNMISGVASGEGVQPHYGRLFLVYVCGECGRKDLR